MGNALGYRSVIVMPETQSQEKKDMLRLCGADLRLVPAVPYANPRNYVRYSETLAEEVAAAEPTRRDLGQPVRQPRQPPRAHYETTGPEIWSQTDGKVDAFVCSVGTGGTLAGVAIALKERNPKVQDLSSPTRWARRSTPGMQRHELKAEGNSITEGIGQSRITKNLEGAPLDGWFQVTDAEMLPALFDLVTEEGLILGGSTGINIVGAMQGGQANWAAATPSSPSWPITARAISRSCSIRLSCAGRTCRCPAGSTANDWHRRNACFDRLSMRKVGDGIKKNSSP